VPVALIGTFAVLLAAGLLANTVSLLALVLAIGIVVDDAIVVVEAVEHVLEERARAHAAEATEKAMGQITGRSSPSPWCCCRCSSRSPSSPASPASSSAAVRGHRVGFDGDLGDQRADALAGALLADPAPPQEADRNHGWMQGRIDRTRDGYTKVVTPLARRGIVALLLVVGFAAATGGIGSMVPSGFLPDEDQGAFMAEVQLPDAASTNRTLAAVAEVEKTIADKPWKQSVFTVSGYSLIDGLALPNRALVVVELKPFDQRKDPSLSVFQALKELNIAFSQIASANVFAFNLPPIMGLGNSSGFEFVVQSLAGASPTDLAAVARGVMISAQEVPELAGVYTTYSASTPQINLKLDRERAQALGISISDIFSAMQTSLGGAYTNDFNLFGRTWQVKVQADASDRSKVNDVFRVRVRAASGELVPLQAVANIEMVTAPSSVVRYNNLRSVVVNGAPAPGYSSGDAIAAMEKLATRTLPAGYGFEWTGTALQEKAGQRPDRLHPGPRRRLRLPVPGRPVRKHGDSGGGAAVGHRRPVRGGDGTADRRSRQQHLRPDRHRGADRARRQERHPDHRVRDGGTREGSRRRHRCDYGRQPAVPRRHDDLLRVHPWPGAAGHLLGRRRRDAARRRHSGVRRHDRRLVPRHLRDPGPLRGVPAFPRDREGLDRRDGHQDQIA
jgi:hypothetical protein